DRTRPLIIDPTLAYSTYLGGGGIDSGSGIAVDSLGNAYVAGTTGSPDFRTRNPYQPALNGVGDAFVTKLGADGSLLYSTYLGGTSADLGQAIAVDGAGNACLTGQTYSADFPTTPGAFQRTMPVNGAGVVAFVTKLDATGSALLFSTYLGGTLAPAGS